MFFGKTQDDYLVQRPVEAGGHLMFGGGRRVAPRCGVGVSDDSRLNELVARYLRTMLSKVMNLGGRYDVIENGKSGTTAVAEGWEDVGLMDDSGRDKELHAEAEWTGVMGYSRDNCPWVGGVPGHDGLWICGGYSGHGKT